jgi:excinuclease UvrABC helicase subunit UvrB
MHVMSRALSHIQVSGTVRRALRLLQEGKREIDALESIPGNQVFEWEKTRALVSLDDLISQLESQVPVTKKDQLRRQLEAAIQEENYERAAVIRDEIARLGRRVRRSGDPAS